MSENVKVIDLGRDFGDVAVTANGRSVVIRAEGGVEVDARGPLVVNTGANDAAARGAPRGGRCGRCGSLGV